nr:PREDICTED: uncharacterized protein LOC108216146 isoform X4 [Daucus carota subsp. sativus]
MAGVSRPFVATPKPKTLFPDILAPFAFATTRSMASSPFQKLQVHRDDNILDAYVVGKENAAGIVVLQEWWGVEFEIKNHAVAISHLYRGKDGLDVAEVQHLMDGLDWQGDVSVMHAW